MARHHASKKQSARSRYHEYAGEERALHGYHPRRSYDTLRHERDEFNDEWRHDAAPEGSGPYMYDRTSKEGYAPGPYAPDVAAARDMGRRRREMKDAGMIHEDPRQIANLPQEVRMESYPVCGPYTPEDIDDTMRGVDRQIDFDDSQKMRHFFPKKV
jgi:hypothetical protein